MGRLKLGSLVGAGRTGMRHSASFANKLLLLVASLVTLALLLGAAYREHAFREWRVLQQGYAAALPEESRADFVIQLRQIVVPALRTTDRCITCHLGMAVGLSAVPGRRVFGAHPPIPHDPADFGCVVCHGGQGLATEKADAHGDVPFWPEPMIPRSYMQAGCGTCHTHLKVPNLQQLERGQALFERYDCLACHAVDGRGGTIRPGAAAGIVGPDLTYAGAKGYDPDWYRKHLTAHRNAASGPWRVSFAPLDDSELLALRTFLDSRVGAPRLIEGKALFHSLGCRGCHKVGGVGGDDGPDLSTAGQKDPGRVSFAAVPEPHTLANWFREHFRNPAAVVPDSLMPILGLSESEIDALVLFTFSLRCSDFPEAYWPKDRILAERFGEREFATDGATLYGTFCAACHGPEGEGRRYPGMAAFPAIGNPDFLALASDEFLTTTVTHGRPGRRMPAWGEMEGGLRPEEIITLVAYLRELGAVEAQPDPRPRRWVSGDVSEGRRLYQAACAGCHGDEGEGGEGPALANPRFLEAATDTYLVETIAGGRRGTTMEGFARPSPARRALSRKEIEAIVSYLRTWEVPNE